MSAGRAHSGFPSLPASRRSFFVAQLACGLLVFGPVACGSNRNAAEKLRPRGDRTTDTKATERTVASAGKTQDQPAAGSLKSSDKSAILTSARRHDQARALAGIEKLEGKVAFDDKKPDRPAIEVDFYQSKVSDADLALLEDLPALQKLDLKGTAITDEGLKQLSVLTDLHTLSLNFTNITGQGLVHLNRLSNLEALDLSFSKIADANLVHLAGLAGLQKLSLQLTDISDAGIAHLEGLRSLRELNLVSTKVTDAAAKRLQASLPTLRIER